MYITLTLTLIKKRFNRKMFQHAFSMCMVMKMVMKMPS